MRYAQFARLSLFALVALLAPTTVAAQDLVLEMSSTDSVVAGTSFQQNFTIHNVGGAPSAPATLTDVLPLGLTYLGDSLDSCVATINPGNGQRTATCSIPGIAVGGSVEFSMNVLVEHDFLIDRGTGFTNMATVPLGGDPTPADNSAASNSVLVTAEADLRITTLIQDNGPVPAGEQINFVILVDNLGPSTATDVNVQETLSTSAFFRANGCSLSVRTDGGLIDEFNCNFALSTGIYELATMGSNWLNPVNTTCDWDVGAVLGQEEFCGTPTERDEGRIIITIDGTSEQAVGLEPFATVASETPDPDTSNNSAVDAGSFFSVADLEITKTAGPATDPGGVATWTILVVNHGPSASSEVVLHDLLPNDLLDGTIQIGGDIFDSDDGTGPSEGSVQCTAGTPGDPADPARCDLGGLPADWSAVVDVSGVVDPAFAVKRQGWPAPLGITNDAWVTSETPDLHPFDAGDCAGNDPCQPGPDAPNFASATLTVNALTPNLSLSAAVLGEDQVPGQAGLIVDPGDLPAFPEAPNYATDPAEVTAGRRLRHTLVVTNNGGAAAHDVELSVQLPAGTSHLPGTLSLSGPGSCQLGTPGNAALPMTCFLGNLGPAAVINVAFDMLVTPFQAPGSVLVQDAAVGAAADADATDNLASTQVVVNTWADTEISLLGIGANVTDWDTSLRRNIIEQLPGQVTAGLGLRYLITVQNQGPSAATNVQILGLMAGQSGTGLDQDPLEVTDLGPGCLDGTFLQEIGVFNPGGGQFGQVVWCNLGTLAAGARHTIDWLALSDPAVPDAFDLTSGTFVWWGPSSPPAAPGSFLPFPFPQIPPELPTTDDPRLDDNFSDSDTQTNTVADLAIETTVSEKMVKAGQDFEMTVSVRNLGPSAARDVDFRIDYPFDEGTEAISYEDVVQILPLPTEVTPTCIEGGSMLDCSFTPGELEPGGEFRVDLSMLVRADIFEDPVLDIDSQTTTSDTDYHVGNDFDTSPLYVNGLTGDFFTELFSEGTQDLDGQSLRLVPDSGASGYTACVEPSPSPVLPDGSETYLVLGDDDFKPVNLSGGKDVRFYGTKYDTVWVGSNGYLTFGAGDIEYRPTLANHFDLPRLAPLFADLDPSLGGDVWWMQMDDRLIVTFDAVPYVDPLLGDQTFQVQMFFDGRLRVVYDTLTGAEALAGLSRGDGIPHPFLASDLSTDYEVCPEIFSDGFESGDTTAWDLP